MSAKFLNERLVTTKNFSPQPNQGQKALREERTATHKVASGDEVERLRQTEDAHLREQTLRTEWTEVLRRRVEVIAQLRQAIALLEHERNELGNRLVLLQDKLDRLEALEARPSAEGGTAALRERRQEIEGAHIELLKLHQPETQPADASPALLSLTVGQLSRLGFALSWPLILALILAALLVVWGLAAALRV